jgi:hypothetical protein
MMIRFSELIFSPEKTISYEIYYKKAVQESHVSLKGWPSITKKNIFFQSFFRKILLNGLCLEILSSA